MPSAASRIDGGTALMALRPAITMTGIVISAKVMPPTSGADRGMPHMPRNTASPSNPKIIEGTAARLLIDTSIRSVHRFLGAYSSRYSADKTPIGKASMIVIAIVSSDPFSAPQIPACVGSVASLPVRNWLLKPKLTTPRASSRSNSALLAAVPSPRSAKAMADDAGILIVVGCVRIAGSRATASRKVSQPFSDNAAAAPRP